MHIVQQPGWRKLQVRRVATQILAFVAFAAPVWAVMTSSGTQILLTWPALGSGTTYYVQSSTDLSNWTSLTNTAATNLSLYLNSNKLSLFRLMASNAPPQSVTLAWNPSFPLTNVAGYYIYLGESTGNYTDEIDVGLATNGVVSDLPVGPTCYFATAAYTPSGSESELSTEIVWNYPLLINIQRLP